MNEFQFDESMDEEVEEIQDFIDEKGCVHPFEIREEFDSNRKNGKPNIEPLERIHTHGVYPQTYWGFSEDLSRILSYGNFAEIYTGDVVVICSKNSEKWRKFSITGSLEYLTEEDYQRLMEVYEMQENCLKKDINGELHVFPSGIQRLLFEDRLDELGVWEEGGEIHASI